MTDQKRRLAAILCADVVGYSRLMGDDEEATVAVLRDRREVLGSASRTTTAGWSTRPVTAF